MTGSNLDSPSLVVKQKNEYDLLLESVMEVVVSPFSRAAVQPVWSASGRSRHLWLWRKHHRGVVRQMDAAWSLLPIHEKPQ